VTTFAESWHIALWALRANWFRAVLTAIGVVIGVASLIAVRAVSAGAQQEVADSIRRLGANVVLVDGEFITIGTHQSATERTITHEDVAAIAKLPMVTTVAPHQDMESLTISAGRYKTTTHLFGITPEYQDIYNQAAESGRLLSPTDVTFGRSVMVLGLIPRRKLFPNQPALGKTVRVGNQEFEVIGIQARKAVFGGENLDNRVFVPLPIVTGALLGGANTKSVSVRIRSEAEIEPGMEAISTLLRRQHRLPPSYADDFSTEDQAAIVKEAQRATTTFRILTFALGAIALLVGGIGIMNMMLVSVHERIREIGIRKSVGAGPWTVQLQFLIEALVLSALGGLVGVLAGIGATRLTATLAGWQVVITAPSVVVALFIAVLVGLVFGYFPARRAARLDPIAALRYE
jgi:putative ABC transport system permease protein